MKPGFENQRELAAVGVDNPYRKGEKETVVKNLRESNARTLRLGPAQTLAYDRVWKLYYMMGHWRNGAVDPSNEPVDCQQVVDTLPEAAAHASQEVKALREALGDDWLLIEATCLYGLGFKEMARVLFGQDKRTNCDEARFMVKAAYNKLCVEMGLSGTPSLYTRLRAYCGGKPGVDETCWGLEK